MNSNPFCRPFWGIVIAALFWAPSPVDGQDLPKDDEDEILWKFERAHRAWLSKNIQPWTWPSQDAPPGFKQLSDSQRNMLQGEANSPDIQYVDLLLEQMQLEAGDTLIDFGCGMGHVESLLLTNGLPPVQIYGLDIDSWALEVAPRVVNWAFSFMSFYNASQKIMDPNSSDTLSIPQGFGFHPILINGDEAGIPEHFARHLMCIRTLHHLPAEAIEQMVSLVKPGGRIYIMDNVAKKSGKSKCRDGEVTFYLTREEIVQRMADAGCELVEELELDKSGGLFVFEP
jgi:SAM-dependent methyltransferase